MKDAYDQSGPSTYTANQVNTDGSGEQGDLTADIGLTSRGIRALPAASPTPEAAELTRELYRLRALLRRTAAFLDLARAFGLDASLDVNLRPLLVSLSDEITSEPASLEQLDDVQMAQTGYSPSAQSWPDAAGRAAARVEAVGAHRGRAYNGGADRERLFTWKLFPEPGRGADIWPHVEYRGLVIVRAHDPVQARTLAAEKLVGTMASGTSQARVNPWFKRALVRVERMHDTTYGRIGVPKVVYP